MPLLIRNGRLILLPPRGEAPLGAEVDREFRELAVPVQEGDLLLFVTDGVFECPGTSWDDGLARLAAEAAANSTLPVERLGDVLIGSINDDTSARDDRVVVIVRVPDRTNSGLPTEPDTRRIDITEPLPARPYSTEDQ